MFSTLLSGCDAVECKQTAPAATAADTSADTEEPDDSSVHVVLPSLSVQFSSITTDYNIIIIF